MSCTTETDMGIPSEDRQSDDIHHMIYRYKFTEDFMADLYKFSKIHQYDDRKDFKEAWTVWTEENSDIIDVEARRLLQLGYDGNILVKMFKSARYYFRKKSDQKKEPKQRRQYITVSHDLLETMDTHILRNVGTPEYQPKNGYVVFCNENETLLKAVIDKIAESGITDKETITNKIKKTYKNRYFMLTNKK